MSRISRNARIVSFVWLLLLTCCCATAQSGEPSRVPQVVEVQFGRSSAWSTDPNESVTTVRPKSVTMSVRSLIGQYAEGKSEYALSSKDWEELRALVNSRMLAALVGTIGCPGCADQQTEWVTVEFDDGTKKSAFYNAGSGPPELAALIAKIQSIAGFGPAIPTGNLPMVQPQLMRPKKPVRVLSIRFGEWSGSCDSDCGEDLQVIAGETTLRRSCFPEAQSRPANFTVRADLSDKHWKELVQLIDHAAIYALPDRSSGGWCGEFVEVKFSDKSRKKLSWATDGPPKELGELRDKLQALKSKLEKELPK
jgi:hypothetical protein